MPRWNPRLPAALCLLATALLPSPPARAQSAEDLAVLQNTVIYTYPSVGQFWTYRPEEFLKQPVYSREFPPCRHC